MGEAQGILGHPGTGLFMMLIIGGLAGWIAGMITEFRHGIFTNILGGKLAEVLDIPVFGFWRVLICAIGGAVIILFVWQRVRARPQV
jgi:uncharacterized membrane protein YeaQ/YmgE (transglycosylase-associated protein family)